MGNIALSYIIGSVAFIAGIIVGFFIAPSKRYYKKVTVEESGQVKERFVQIDYYDNHN